MVIIAEAGATSTRWRAIDAQGQVTAAKCGGVNVATIARATVEERILMAVSELNPSGERLERVHFYAAGMLADEVSSLFPGVEVECASDLLAAARAVCGHKPGIAAILGTGSNSCFFDALLLLLSFLLLSCDFLSYKLYKSKIFTVDIKTL